MSAENDAHIAANKAVMEWIDADSQRALIGCTPSMVAQVAVGAYKRSLATQSRSAEQDARDLLERLEVEGAQSYSSGELVELANIIADAHAYRKGVV